MIKLLPSSSHSAATQVLNIPELLEQILYFVLTCPTLDTPTCCKTANILRSISSIWAGTIDSSPTLSSLAFRNRKLSPTKNEKRNGDLNIPFLQSLKYEFSEIEQLRYSQGIAIGLKELKQFKKSQRIPNPKFPKLRRALGLPKYPPSSTKYLASDVLLMQPPPPKTVDTYLHFSGWGDLAWIGWLERFSRPGDFHKLGNTIEFKYWYKITDSSGGNGITGADVVNALTKVLAAFYTFDKGFFEVLHIELAVGNIVSPAPQVGWEYMYRWYLWHPKRFGGGKDIFDIAMKVADDVIWVADVICLTVEVAGKFIALITQLILYWLQKPIRKLRRAVAS